MKLQPPSLAQRLEQQQICQETDQISSVKATVTPAAHKTNIKSFNQSNCRPLSDGSHCQGRKNDPSNIYFQDSLYFTKSQSC